MRIVLLVMLCGMLLVSAADVRADDAATAARIKMLVAAAKDPDSNVRTAAIRALGAMRDPQTIPALLGFMRTPDESVRAIAANALSEMADPTCFDAFVRATRDPSRSVRMSALRALGKLRGRRAIPALMLSMSDESGDVAALAANALVAMGNASVDGLAKAMDGTPATRYRAANALVRIGTPEAVGKLKAAATHADWFVRLDAVRASTGLQRPPVDMLVRATKDPNDAVRLAAAEALVSRSHPRGPQARAALMPLLADRSDRVRYVAANALRGDNDPKLPKLFAPLLHDSSADIRRAAAENIARSKDLDALSALAARTGDSYEAVRRYAVTAITKLPPERSVPALTQVALGGDSDTALQAIRALSDVPDGGGIDALGKVLREAAGEPQRYTARLLAEKGGPAGVKHFQAAWPKADAALKRETLARLHPNSIEAAMGLLATAVEDPDTQVRDQALRLMGRNLASQAAAERLIAASASKSPDVAHGALSLLATNTTDKALPAVLDAAAQRNVLLEENWNIEHLRPVVSRLARDGGEKAFGPLHQAANKAAGNPDLRGLYLIALGVTGNPKAGPTLLEGLKDRNETVRCAAAAGMGYLGNAKAAGPLRAAAAAKDRAGIYALAAWARIDAKGAFESFCKMLKAQAGTSSYRRRLADTMPTDKTRDVTAALLAFAASGDRYLAQSAGQWLVAAGDSRAVPGLKKISLDPEANSYAKSAASQAFQKIQQYRRSLQLPSLPVR